MFKKISYMCMLASVLLSWGVLISFAQQADQTELGIQAATVSDTKIIVESSYSSHSYVSGSKLPALEVKNRVKLRKTPTPAKTIPKSTSTPITTSTAQ